MQNILNTLKHYTSILRLYYSVLTICAFLSGIIIANGSIPNIWVAILGSIAVGPLFQGGVRVANDFFDYELDKKAKEDYPIATGKISLKNALIYFNLLFLLSLTIAYLININMFIILFIGMILSHIYNAPPFRLKKRAVIGDISIALGYGVMMPIVGYIIYKPITTIPLEFLSILFFFHLTIAISSKFKDAHTDKKFNIGTFQTYFGWNKAINYMYLFSISGFSLIIIYSLLNLIPTKTLFLIPLFILPHKLKNLLKDYKNNKEKATKIFKKLVFFFWPLVTIGLAILITI
jgi:chlorophyll/bacteriochlorophyll a synthase